MDKGKTYLLVYFAFFFPFHLYLLKKENQVGLVWEGFKSSYVWYKPSFY